ncbi:unnamed protein product [Sphacelaria rigidula]
MPRIFHAFQFFGSASHCHVFVARELLRALAHSLCRQFRRRPPSGFPYFRTTFDRTCDVLYSLLYIEIQQLIFTEYFRLAPPPGSSYQPPPRGFLYCKYVYFFISAQD